MNSAQSTNSKDFLKENLFREAVDYFGVGEEKYIEFIVEAWMNDAGNSKHRFDVIGVFLPGAAKILDLASGCGTCVYYGLMNGYDMYGVEPELWKHTFNRMKSREYGYPPEWQSRFLTAYGESLPFADNCFDCVTTYQTLEHVADLRAVISEMVRVSRPGGGIHIRCPDYRSTFEPHYRLPWLPLFPRAAAKAYLRLAGSPTAGLDTIQYVTRPRILKMLREIESNNQSTRLQIIDADRRRFREALRKRSIPAFPGAFSLWKTIEYATNLFRAKINVNIFVHVLEKGVTVG